MKNQLTRLKSRPKYSMIAAVVQRSCQLPLRCSLAALSIAAIDPNRHPNDPPGGAVVPDRHGGDLVLTANVVYCVLGPPQDLDHLQRTAISWDGSTVDSMALGVTAIR